MFRFGGRRIDVFSFLGGVTATIAVWEIVAAAVFQPRISRWLTLADGLWIGLAQANPNLLELLFMPGDCIRKNSPEMQMLAANRQLFITKQCADTHAGYAMSQIKKAKGQNKWINNPKPETAPAKEDFCHVIPWQPGSNGPPARPIPLRATGWSLNEYHAARLEHSRDTYRLYRYGAGARGVFRGDALVCESIPEALLKCNLACNEWFGPPSS